MRLLIMIARNVINHLDFLDKNKLHNNIKQLFLSLLKLMLHSGTRNKVTRINIDSSTTAFPSSKFTPLLAHNFQIGRRKKQ